ncbi:MAG: sensor histidine kinase [Pseudomonadales bacterium]
MCAIFQTANALQMFALLSGHSAAANWAKEASSVVGLLLCTALVPNLLGEYGALPAKPGKLAVVLQKISLNVKPLSFGLLAITVCLAITHIYLAINHVGPEHPLHKVLQPDSLVLGFGLFWLLMVSSGLRSANTDFGFHKTPIHWSLVAMLMGVMLLMVVDNYFDKLGKHSLVDTLAHCVTVPFAVLYAWYRYRLEFIDVIVKQFARLGVLIVLHVLCVWQLASVSEAIKPLTIAAYTVVTVILILQVGKWMDRLWMPKIQSRAAFSDEFAKHLTQCTTSSAAIDMTRATLADLFETEVGINAKLSQVAEVVEYASEPNLKIELGFIRNKYPWFSEALQLVRAASNQLHSHLKVLAVQAEQRRQALINKELAELAAKAELSAMRAQIRPHFLFNVLHTIQSFIKEDPDKAERTLQLLADLMRSVLQSSEQDVYALQQEISLASIYLEIEKTRFGDQLGYAIDIEPGVEGQLIPPFSLQPLIENAVKYSVDKQLGAANIQVRALTEGDDLVVTVSDNGPGIEDEKQLVKHEGGFGLALQNIRERLSRLYGDAASLSLANGGKGGAVAELRIQLTAMHGA